MTTNGTTTTGIRYYTFAGQTIAETTASTLYWIDGNNQGSMTTAVAAFDESGPVIRRALTPYGAPVTGTGTWPDNRTLLDDPYDSATGLVTVGARQLNPATGLFISVDPILDTSSPQTMTGYSYAGADPVSQADPTGQHVCGYGDASNPCLPVPTQTNNNNPGGNNDTCPPSEDGCPGYQTTSTTPGPGGGSLGALGRLPIDFATRLPKINYGALAWATHLPGINSPFWNARNLPYCDSSGCHNLGGNGDWNNSWFAKHIRGIGQIAIGVVAGGAIIICAVASGGACAVLVTAAIGAGSGAADYAVSGGEHSWKGYLINTGFGAASGALTGSMGALGAPVSEGQWAFANGWNMATQAYLSEMQYMATTPTSNWSLSGMWHAAFTGAANGVTVSPKFFGFNSGNGQ